MLYQSIDGHQYNTRAKIRRHCKNNGMNKNLKFNYFSIPENESDKRSVHHKKEWKKNV